MADLVSVAAIAGFFAVAAGFVKACEKIIGSDEPASARDVAGGGGPDPQRRAA